MNETIRLVILGQFLSSWPPALSYNQIMDELYNQNPKVVPAEGYDVFSALDIHDEIASMVKAVACAIDATKKVA